MEKPGAQGREQGPDWRQRGARVNWTGSLFEVIDPRSFSNLWFWIALAVMWSTARHRVLGVPFDMVIRARKHGGEAGEDLAALTAINVRRMMHISRVSGLWLVGLIAFLLTLLGLLGFVYGIEFAQAGFCLALPLTLVGAMSLRAAAGIEAAGYAPSDLTRRLGRHRMAIQFIGMISIFVTALWGMFQNLKIGAI